MLEIKYKGKEFGVFAMVFRSVRSVWFCFFVCSWVSSLIVVVKNCVHLSKYLAMEAASSKTNKLNEARRGRKKKKGGMKFSGSKALRRSALRKRDASGSCKDDRIIDEADKNNEDEAGGFGKTIKMRVLNLDAVEENVEGEDGGDNNNAMEKRECRMDSKSRSDSLGFEHDSDEEGIDGVVSSKTLKP
jgi:hypothetical protein